MVASTRPIEELCRPEKHDEFYAPGGPYEQMFVTDVEDINQKRRPGLLKEEIKVNNGSWIALSPKVSFRLV